MHGQWEEAMLFAPVPEAPGQARRMLRQTLAGAGIDPFDEVTDQVLLLASELFENAVLHAGTDFEVSAHVNDDEVAVAVRDRGAGPLELHLAQPRQRYGRAASHGRGLAMVARLASAWGTRHDADGTHQIWFTVSRHPTPEPGSAEPSGPDRPAAAEVDPAKWQEWPDADQARWLLGFPTQLGAGLSAQLLVAELARRLRELLKGTGVAVDVDHGDGAGSARLALDGLDPGELPPADVIDVALPLTKPLRGRLRIAGPVERSVALSMAGVIAHRIALAVESDWLRDAERRRRDWTAYLADTSELLGQTLDVELTVTVVPQIVVPRLGEWCAVFLPDELGRLGLTALSHADENAIPELRDALDPTAGAGLAGALRTQLTPSATAPTWFGLPTDGIAVPLTAGGRPIGVLTVGRPPDRAHTLEDVALIADIARRAAVAIDNAQRADTHAKTSRALQQALLPRALPVASGIEFAASYLPVGPGSEVGGDFYDVLPLAGDSWLVTIGDVCGKGPRAAGRTSLVRDVLRVLFKDRRSLSQAVRSLNEVMMEAGDPTQFCTLAAAAISAPPPATGELAVDLVLAGHPRPILVRADGSAELVGRHGTALGLVDRIELACTSHLISPDEMLLLYTDGVTECRRGREQFGSERLLAACAGHPGRSVEHLVGTVRTAVEAFATADRRDDIALLAVRATGR